MTDASKPLGRGEHLVRPGDCILSIAAEHGLDWQEIWNDSNNEELRRHREDPGTLLPGDRVALPARREVAWLKVKRGQSNRYLLELRLCELRLVLRRRDENRAGLAFRLEVEGLVQNGETTENGELIAKIPARAKTALLTLMPDTDDAEELELNLGALHPVQTHTGIQTRLKLLGRYAGPTDGTFNLAYRHAVHRLLTETNAGDQDQQTRLEQRTRELSGR